tara:strand:- start:491 stop:1042 length:552 start_codon:yes stop_codon:yes gene_type:complete
MATSGDRAGHFPSIEKKHGYPVQYWLDLLESRGSTRYAEQMELLQAGHGFSRAHANAVVMSFRGSPSQKGFASPEDYLESLGSVHRKLVTDILESVQRLFPELTLVIAWNQPILRNTTDYVFGVSVSKNHVSINPFTPHALAAMTERLAPLDVLKYTVRIPLDWQVDDALLRDMVQVRLSELS